jgi:hypothetical protein
VSGRFEGLRMSRKAERALALKMREPARRNGRRTLTSGLTTRRTDALRAARSAACSRPRRTCSRPLGENASHRIPPPAIPRTAELYGPPVLSSARIRGWRMPTRPGSSAG